jgi:hypothetical protein
MSDVPAEILSGVLAIADDEFYEKDAARLAERRRIAGSSPFEGLALACPSCLRDHRLPLLLLAAQSDVRIAQVNPYDNRMVVAAPLGRGRPSVGPYHPREPVAKNPEPEEPRDFPADANPVTIRSLLLVDVSAALVPRLPESGAVAVRVIEWDRTSNTVTTLLDAADPDEAVDQAYDLDDALALHRSVEFHPARFARSAESPELAGPGIALSLPRAWPAAARGVVLRGTVRTALDAGHLVDPKWRDPLARADSPEPEVLPRAILTGALLLARLGTVVPARVDFTLPVYRDAPLQAGDVVEAWFSIELEGPLRGHLGPGEQLAYGVLGAHTHGPTPVVVG